ncbi:MAG TPA: asparagine synthase (glutamine-hydrolyzing) [Longimicrobiaceae bacterium]|nr:asparagine synthase (glutamine-hydrolyzing) [Longimicrobiaceae bacterium]
MCGFAGYFSLNGEAVPGPEVVARMTGTLVHRGPDSGGCFAEEGIALGFRRLSIIDLHSGDQPLYNEDGSLVLLCNGEIYNYRELRRELVAKGHVFRTESDVEVLLHLWEEHGTGLLDRLNGQFAFALYDRRARRLFLARDHFGINPLYYTTVKGRLVFGSEIKAILEHPGVPREVDPTGLDQVLSFPGLVSPRTAFRDIRSLKSGHYLLAEDGDVRLHEYWDLDYPREDEVLDALPESHYVERLAELLTQSVRYRLNADVPVGYYLSGGLDSSLIAALIHEVSPDAGRHSFSIGFTDREKDETGYQRMVAAHVGSEHHEIVFDWDEISSRMWKMIYHCECPVKESYNTCSMALSEAVRGHGIPVVLTGEGADELFAGYVGYRFDRSGRRGGGGGYDLDEILEEDLRERMWGCRDLFYEKGYHAFRETKSALYSDGLNESFHEFECANHELVNHDRLRGRHYIHQRSYLDFKLRLSDHLVADHGDRMALANSVEARYPFLDVDVVRFAARIPPELKLRGLTEKYILKEVAGTRLPREVVHREKFGFHAPGSPALLRSGEEWVHDLLSEERIRRQGVFNPVTVERLKAQYSRPGFRLNLPFEDDLLMTVLTFQILAEQFGLAPLR